jgi:hypothetical protein
VGIGRALLWTGTRLQPESSNQEIRAVLAQTTEDQQVIVQAVAARLDVPELLTSVSEATAPKGLARARRSLCRPVGRTRSAALLSQFPDTWMLQTLSLPMTLRASSEYLDAGAAQ